MKRTKIIKIAKTEINILKTFDSSSKTSAAAEILYHFTPKNQKICKENINCPYLTDIWSRLGSTNSQVLSKFAVDPYWK